MAVSSARVLVSNRPLSIRYVSAVQRGEVGLLFVRQAQRRRSRRSAEGLEHRAFRSAARRIEGSAAYRESLQRLLELEQRFKRTLGPAERSAWLELEEALLEHAAGLHRSYFDAGVAIGRAGSAAQRAEAVGGLRPRDLEVAAALARVLAKLTRRAKD